MVDLLKFGVILILSKTITCWLTQGQTFGNPGCNMYCHHGECHGSVTNYYCKCNPGWHGDRCDQESCTSSSCEPNGFCSMATGICHCHTGYSGLHCQVDVCASNPCQNGGNCNHRSNGRGYECNCINHYTGDNCEIVEICASNPCQNGGFCHHRSNNRGYECNCFHHYTGDNCEVAPVPSAIETTQTMAPATSPTTTPTPLTTATTTTPTPLTTATTTTKPSPSTTQTTTLVPSFTTKCSKFVTVLDMAEKVIESSILATPCSSGNHSSHEAFVLNICHLGIPSIWKQGINVMTFCDKIPAYTPIASFENGKYSSTDSRSGIFIGCLHGPDGFKAAFQRCDEVAEIESITVGDVMFNNNPHNYFTVES